MRFYFCYWTTWTIRSNSKHDYCIGQTLRPYIPPRRPYTLVRVPRSHAARLNEVRICGRRDSSGDLENKTSFPHVLGFPLDSNPHKVQRSTIMDRNSEVEVYLRTLPSDASFLVLDSETEEFFKAETGIQDSEELKKHIVEVQEEAYKVSHRPCADCVHPRVGVMLDLTLRFSRTLASAGSDSRSSRSQRSPHTHTSLNW